MKRAIILLASTLAIASCGSSSSGDTPPANKGLFSLWNNTATNAPLDLRDGAFSTPMDITFFYEGGEQCLCALTVIGSQSSGINALNFCEYVEGSGTSDPGCNALNSTSTYSLSDSLLTLFGSEATTTWR